MAKGTSAHKPGEISPKTDDYIIVNRNGGKTKLVRRVEADDRFPPTPKPGQKFIPARLRPRRSQR